MKNFSNLLFVAMLTISLFACNKEDDNSTSNNQNKFPIVEEVPGVYVMYANGTHIEVEKGSKYKIPEQTINEEGFIVKYFVDGQDASGKEIVVNDSFYIEEEEFITISYSDGTKEEVKRNTKHKFKTINKDNDGLIVIYIVDGKPYTSNETVAGGNMVVEEKLYAVISYPNGTSEQLEKGSKYTIPSELILENGLITRYFVDNENVSGKEIEVSRNIKIVEKKFEVINNVEYQVLTLDELKESDFSDEEEVFFKVEIDNEYLLFELDKCLTTQTNLLLTGDITYIRSSSFSSNFLKSIIIPNSVTRIDKKAFSYCESLQSIEIPNSVKSIGDYAFDDCIKLQSIEIPNSVTSIGEYAFLGCSSLKSVTLSNSVTTIGSNAFSTCINLQSIEIPNSLTAIKEYTFHNCRSLTSITIPNSVKTIENSAFSFCSRLTSITLSNSLETIGESAFGYCSALKSIIIPNSVTTIEERAFQYCNQLSKITINNSKENVNIDAQAFIGCNEPVFTQD